MKSVCVYFSQANLKVWLATLSQVCVCVCVRACNLLIWIEAGWMTFKGVLKVIVSEPLRGEFNVSIMI